jgi:electron transfer flavoprotein alpha subunit
VVAVSIGPKQCSETLRTALAMGCDRGIHILTDLRTDYMDLQPYAVAQLLQKIVQQESSDLVLLGKQGIDSDCGQTGPLLAGLMGWPQVTFAANVQVDGSSLVVERETDAGTESNTRQELSRLQGTQMPSRHSSFPFQTFFGIIHGKRKLRISATCYGGPKLRSPPDGLLQLH